MKAYQETLHWLYNKLPMYQQQGAVALNPKLDNTRLLATQLGNPQNAFKSVHVAGTNGKGSTSHMLASVLQLAGYKTGLYTSPHLKDFRERIKVNGQCISETDVIAFVETNKAFFEKERLSFFEMTVGMAFWHFAQQQVDIAVVEVGLGGRFDSTNIILPQLSVITNIGLDHTQFLGDTLAKIAFEKAGIIKPNIPTVVGETQTETAPVFKEVAAQNRSPIYFADQMVEASLPTDLKGSYQQKNVKTAMMAVRVLRDLGYKLPREIEERALASVVVQTGLMGRWQQLGSNPTIICDTAHNKDGLRYVLNQLAQTPHTNLHLVIGMVSDKDTASILPLFPKNARYYFCKPNLARAKDAGQLKEEALQYGLMGASYDSVKKAYEAALAEAHPTDLVFVGGSTFVVAEVL